MDDQRGNVTVSAASRLRVLRIIPTIDPEVGGPSNSAVNAAIAESRAGVATTFVFTGSSRSLLTTAPARTRLANAGARTLLFPRPRRYSEAAGLWGVSPKMLVWIARHTRHFDVIHLHYVWTLSSVWGAIVASVSGRPVVLTAHESLTRYDIDTASGSRLKRRAKLAVRALLMRHVDVVVSASELEERDSLMAGEHGVVISHPVVECPIEEVPAEPVEPPLTIGYLGRLHAKKKVDLLLRAFALLEPVVGGSPQLIVCGDGEPAQREVLRELAAELGIEDRVEWRGHVGPEGRAELFSSVHLTVMPSAYECFGMAAAEAMAAGVPVVVSATTGLAPIVEEFGAGRVVHASAPEDLAAALARLANAPVERARMRAAAARATRKRLSFTAYGAAITDAYRDLVPKSRAAPVAAETPLATAVAGSATR